jgi:hypothetical protein
MRKLTLITAAAGMALAFAAAPASAQYAPQYQPQYRPVLQGNAYGYNNYGQFRAMQARIDGIQRQVEHLRSRRMITRREADGLRSESRQIEQRLRQAARYGLNHNEARNIDHRITRLERHVAREVRDGRGYGWDNRRQGDRDRDGRADRYEDNRGNIRD